MRKDKHSNNHRANKRCFTANLKPSESSVVDEVKRLTECPTDRGLIIRLTADYLSNLGRDSL